MPQTTAAVIEQCAKVEMSADGITYVDISGNVQSWSNMTQTRSTGEAYTFSGDTAIVGAGKRQPLDATFNIVYTETDADVYQVIRNQFENTCGGLYYIRISPKGGDAGEERIVLYGVISSFTYPEMDASTGQPVMAGFVIHAGSVTSSVIAS
ncbi:MAG TPA: hypothetical protein VM537_25870 [Anaerolineae bacterium]|nr:hypothetical protein [Anaerolineae bacterium]